MSLVWKVVNDSESTHSSTQLCTWRWNTELLVDVDVFILFKQYWQMLFEGGLCNRPHTHW